MLRKVLEATTVAGLCTLFLAGCPRKYTPSDDASTPENTVAACTDSVDNDGDGDIDCADSDCQGLDVCIETDCTNGVDDDGDGLTDCLDTDCQPTFDCRENTAAACNDGIDNDGDGLTDCEDDECSGMLVCNVESNCSDGVDNDNDGDTDCDDSDCTTSVDCGGFCYDLTYQAPALWGMAITEANDDQDPSAACVQYDVVVLASTPQANTQVCLYIDDLSGAAVGCADPMAQNPVTFRVDLCAGDHNLWARVESGGQVCETLNMGLEQTQVTVYENPSCTITSPAGLSTDQANPTCYGQDDIDVEVTTSGASAELWVAGALAYSTPSNMGVVQFPTYTLGADGSMIVRAQCFNPGTGNGSTWSPDYYILKDTQGPTVQILSPATGAAFSAQDCQNGIDVVVTGVEAGQEVCANYTGQTPPPAACSSASTGVSDQLTLTVQCIDGVDLTLEANTEDSCGNAGQDTIVVTADTGLPAVLIESPADGQVYNKAADTIDPVTDDFELNITACTDQAYNPADITLTIDGVVSPMTPTVVAASCLGLSHRISWTAPHAFSQAPSGLQTPHTVEVEVSDGFNSSTAQAAFTNDTVAPVLSVSCPLCLPDQAFYTPSDDNCTATSEFEVATRVSVFGLEIGRPVTLAVTSGGSPVGSSPYQELAFATSQHYLEFAAPCGVELQMGQNQLSLTTTDEAGNVAVPAEKVVSYGAGSIQSPSSGALLSVGDDCDAGSSYGIEVLVEVDSGQPDNTPVEVFASSSAGAWSYPTAGSDVWMTDCSVQGTPCQHTFCIAVPTSEVEQSDIVLDLQMSGASVPGAPAGITVDISAPPVATSPALSVASRRAAQIQLSWDSVEDPQTGVLASWDVRCVRDAPITAGNWATAMQFAGEPGPASAGTGQTMLIAEDTAGNKIRAGHEYYCAIRGTNTVGLQSDLATFPGITSSEIGLLQYAGTIDGYTQYDYFWWYWPSISPAGDVDGDGYDDLLVGYGGATIGGHAAAIVMGSATGPTTPVNITCADASFGAAMAGIGDFDHDGHPDIAVGAPDQDRVYIFRGGAGFGSSTFDCTSADVIIIGPSGSWLGSVVAPVGDFDGDSFADLAMGAITDNAGDGAAFVLFGRSETSWPVTVNLASGANADGALHINGDPGSGAYLGDSITAWDFDKDGAAEVVMGVPLGGSAGQVAILSGDLNPAKTPNTVVEVPFSALQVVSLPGSTLTNAALGLGLTPIDMDGDGWVDLAVGARWGDYGGSYNSGNVLVFANDGAGTIQSTYSAELHGAAANDALGVSVGGMFNMTLSTPVPWRLNGLLSSSTDQAIFTGAKQWSISGNTSTGPGYAVLLYAGFSGSVSVSAADLTFAAPSGAVSYHWAAFVGDLNGDGFVDLAVGDPEYGAGGRIEIFY